jgi:glycosyltransferase involved in cell wall biosynthesis
MPRDVQQASHSPLNILVIAPTPFFADRGCHVRIYEQCRAARRAGHRVTICTYHLGRNLEDLEIRRSLRVPWYRRLSAGPSLHKFYIDALLLCTVLRQCLRRRPDVIHAHLHEGVVLGWIASKLFGAPMVADIQGSLSGELIQHGFVREGGRMHRLFAWAERQITRMPRMVIASSSGTLESLPGGLMDSSRACVLRDGADTEQFYFDKEGRSAVRDRLGIDEGTQVLGYLGVLTDYQGVPVLLKAAARVLKHHRPRPHFLIMGYPDVERYRAQAETLGIAEHVTFTGRIPYDAARAYLSACDLAVSPKLSQTEANGKLLNYLAVGLPILASDTPINREILGDAGLLTPPGDDGALAEAMMHMLSDHRAMHQLAARAAARAHDHSWETIGSQLMAIYDQVRGMPASGGPARTTPHLQGLQTVQTP